jgi:hypothetical protein
MKKVLGFYLATSLTVGTAFSQNPPGGAEPTLQAGIKQFGDGDLAGAVFTLESVIRNLTVEPALHAKELSQAYLYRGAAFVGLTQEENAKGSFAAALKYDKNLRIGEDRFSPRVVRVFEAARTGKTKSVLLPPSNVAKKAGIGALGIVGIVAGVAAIGGGVAAATHSNPPPTTPALPTASDGGITLSFLSSSPSSGSTISLAGLAPGPCGGSGASCISTQLVVNISLKSDSAIAGTFSSALFKGGSACLYGPGWLSVQVGGGVPFNLAAGQTTNMQLSPYAWNPSTGGACRLPLTTDRMVFYYYVGTTFHSAAFENVPYTFVQ